MKAALFKDYNMMKRTRQKGFTLVEIMVVIAIIVVIAVIAVPVFIRSKMAANEAGAIAACRSVFTANNIYFGKNQCFPGSLSELSFPAADPPYIDADLASATTPRSAKSGYYYDYQSDNRVGFELNAIPQSDFSGSKYFYINFTGVIHYDTGQRANAQDPNL